MTDLPETLTKEDREALARERRLLRDRIALAVLPELVRTAAADGAPVDEMMAVPQTLWLFVDAIMEARA